MHKNIFNIESHLPFLDSLAESLLRQYGENPLVFSNISIFLPSRRACKELAEAFLRVSGGKPMLLPKIQPLGDLDDEEIVFKNVASNSEIPNIISSTRQRLILTQLIEKWQSVQNSTEKITTPQAAHLAIELAAFLGEVQKQQLSFSEIEKIVPDDLSKHWQTTLNFLSILIEKWPEILADNQAVDIHTHRNLSLKLQAEYWQENPSKYPVIAAGSTGSIPATAELLKVICSMQNGQVILSGLDNYMDDKAWEKISPTHPQYGLKTLLEHIGVGRGDVKRHAEFISASHLTSKEILKQVQDDEVREESLNCATHNGIDRNRLLSQIMLPAEVTHQWNKIKSRHAEFISASHLASKEILKQVQDDEISRSSFIISANQLAGIEVINAANLQEEATVIALKMKQILQTKTKTAALITNRRDLAKRVSAILQRWDVQIDDSAGCALQETPQAVFLRLLAQMVADKATSPISLLNCLKNPYANCGLGAREFRDNVRKLEISSLRGVRGNDGFASLYKNIRPSEKEFLSASFPELSTTILGESHEIALEFDLSNSGDDIPHRSSLDKKLINWLKNIEDIIKPMLELMSFKQVPFDDMLKKHIAVAQNMAENDTQSGIARLWSSASGECLKEFLDELLISAKGFKNIDPSDYVGLLDALLAGQTYRPPYGSHPRLFILSPIEARMLRFDLVILGELNEGSWPMSGKSDPWMSRPMRSSFGLPLPEKKIGQSAHDFVQLLASPNVVITRCEKLDGTQTIPSRWLLRLDAILNILGQQDAIKPKEQWQKWAKMLNKPEYVKAIQPPAPNPPVESRPKNLSVTSIEKLMRDPYWIYANKILHLKKLDDIDKEPAAAEFGNFIHDTLEVFVKEYDSIEPENRYNYLLEAGRQILQKENLKPAVISFWWPRFERIALWIIQNEEERRKNGITVLSEIKGKYIINCKDGIFTLEARADRFEIDKQGNIAIIDYKTGTPPASLDVRLGLSPQMTLEGIIANNNGFEKQGRVVALEYWKLSGGQTDAKIQNAGYKKADEIKQLIEDAQDGVSQLVDIMFFKQTPMLSCPNPDKAIAYNDYEHLERLKEWGE
jgi:ATP-dependent helicase/nuclease subunit B